MHFTTKEQQYDNTEQQTWHMLEIKKDCIDMLKIDGVLPYSSLNKMCKSAKALKQFKENSRCNTANNNHKDSFLKYNLKQ